MVRARIRITPASLPSRRGPPFVPFSPMFDPLGAATENGLASFPETSIVRGFWTCSSRHWIETDLPGDLMSWPSVRSCARTSRFLPNHARWSMLGSAKSSPVRTTSSPVDSTKKSCSRTNSIVLGRGSISGLLLKE